MGTEMKELTLGPKTTRANPHRPLEELPPRTIEDPARIPSSAMVTV